MQNDTIVKNGSTRLKEKTPASKYSEVAQTLRQEIQTGVWQPGERLPGERDLARRFDVSYLTVRQGITNLVQENVLMRIPNKGTFVRQDKPRMESRMSRQMALFLPSDLLRADPYYFPEVYEGFQAEVEAQGRSVTLYSYEALDQPGALEPGTAIACLLFEHPTTRIVESLRDNGYPVLAINQYSGRRSIPTVRIDDSLGMEQAVDYLVSLGHRRIGFLKGPDENIDAVLRLRGFRAAVKRHGLRVTPEAGQRFTEASGYSAARNLLAATNRPTALVCSSDLCALGAIKAARDYGISVPRGLSIVGYGDFSVADYLSPSLTTIRQQRRSLGKAAAKSLILLSDGQEPADVVLTTELIIRESTAPNVTANVMVTV